METEMQSIAIWATFFPPHVGGYEKNVFELAHRLIGIGYKVEVITCQLNKSPNIEVIQRVTVTRLPSWLLLKGLYPVPKPSRALFKVLCSRHNIIITQTRFFTLSFIGAIYSLLHGKPLIHVERGSSHVSIANPLVSFISKVYDHTIGAWIMHRACKVIGVSGATCSFAKHLGAIEPIRIPNGIDKVEPAYSEHNNNILFVGRLIQSKGVQDLIEAYKQLAIDNPLVIVGTGVYKEQLVELGNGNSNIKFLGKLIGKELDNAYKSARLFVNPSYSEGLPTSVMEAVAYRVPVIATDVGGTSEIIENKVTGLLVKPKDTMQLYEAIKYMLGNYSLALEMTSKAHDKVLREYNWDNIVNQYKEIIDEATTT